MFFNFWHLFSKYTFLRLSHLNFSVAVRIYKIHVFDEAFFLLTIRMPMTTKLFRVVTCGEELSPINMHDNSIE